MICRHSPEGDKEMPSPIGINIGHEVSAFTCQSSYLRFFDATL